MRSFLDRKLSRNSYIVDAKFADQHCQPCYPAYSAHSGETSSLVMRGSMSLTSCMRAVSAKPYHLSLHCCLGCSTRLASLPAKPCLWHKDHQHCKIQVGMPQKPPSRRRRRAFNACARHYESSIL